MSPNNPIIGKTGGMKMFIRERVSPRLTNFYAKLGFADRNLLTQNLQRLETPQADKLLDLLVQRGVLKERFRTDLSNLQEIDSYMLSGSATLGQIHQLSRDTGMIFTPEEFFSKTLIDVGEALDRIFPAADGTHGRLAHCITTSMRFHLIADQSGAVRLSFLSAISLGIIATLSSPLLFPVIGSYLCGAGLEIAGGMKIASGLLTAAGLAGRIATKYVHREGENGADPWYGWIARHSRLSKATTTVGMIGLYTS